MNNEQAALADLETKEGCRIMLHVRKGDKIAYVFSQDFTDGKRSYGYVLPRDNGASWVYLASTEYFMKSETEIEKILRKMIVKQFRDEEKEITAAVEEKVLAQKNK